MEGIFRRYPIGIQSFERLRNDNCVYIDKTELIYRLVNTQPSPTLWKESVSFHS